MYKEEACSHTRVAHVQVQYLRAVADDDDDARNGHFLLLICLANSMT
jgi:hypothetical protein